MDPIRKPIAMALAGIGNELANAENLDISRRRASEQTDFTNDEIKDGFFKIAFNAELQLGAPIERVRKFDEPVRIFVVRKGAPRRFIGAAGRRTLFIESKSTFARRTSHPRSRRYK